MLPFALAGIVGDQIYLKGLKTRDILQFELASFIFPFDKDILVGPAEFKISNLTVDELTYRILKEAIKYDPNSARLLGMYMQFANHFGNKNEAKLAFEKLNKIAPNLNVLKQINQNDYKGY